MGLDVGVVNITYLERPDEPVYDFLLVLAEGRLGEDWGGGWEGNALIEFEEDVSKIHSALARHGDTFRAFIGR